MGVSLLDFLLGVKESAQVEVGGAFKVHDDDVLAVQDTDSHLEVLRRLGGDFVLLHRAGSCRNWIDFNPALQDSLANATRRVVDLAILDRLISDSVPFHAEEPVFKVDEGGSNEVVSEDGIIVPHLNLERSAAWEGSFKIVALVEVRVRLVELVVVSLIEYSFVALEVQIRIRSTSIVSRRHVVARDHVDAYDTLGLSEETPLQDLIGFELT